LLTTLSGCFNMTADDLYSLPQASKEYLKLQEQINTVLATGAEYSPPTAGINRQSVQHRDLDGDGKNEALVFFKTTEDKPLKIYIYKQTDGTYQTADVIEGIGTGIERIQYADMDGDGDSELIVGWQIAALLHMSIYSYHDNQHSLLRECDYSRIVTNDMNGDGNTDIMALRLPSAELPGEADLFTLRPDGAVDKKTTALSKGIAAISRIYRGKLSDNTPAVFVESDYNGGVITDILTWCYGNLVNVSVSSVSGASEDTVRAYAIYSADINSDGIREIPSPWLLPSAPETKYYAVDWYAYDKFGHKNSVFSTYHDNSDGWYLILPADWKDSVTVRREDAVSGERKLIFSYMDASSMTDSDAKPVDFLEIYTLTGDNREDSAKLPGRFPLREQGDTIYAAKILTTLEEIKVTQALIVDNFELIYPEWTTGVM
jgi:hypothetical protein